jgi:hypothetical protein
VHLLQVKNLFIYAPGLRRNGRLISLWQVR